MQLSPALSTMSILSSDSNSISSVTLRWLPRSLLARACVVRARRAVPLPSRARRRLVSLSKWNWNDTKYGFLEAPYSAYN